MTRKEIVREIANREVAALPQEQRGSLLLDWWTLGAGDPEWKALPSSLQIELQSKDAPDDARDRKYDPLLIIGVAHQYWGVRNEYLQRKAQALGIDVDVVTGEPELLEACPCCLYHTLLEKGAYDICPVCMWEDDGQRHLDEYSHPNRMTLREGRSNFAALGASSPQPMGSTRRELREAYPRYAGDVTKAG